MAASALPQTDGGIPDDRARPAAQSAFGLPCGLTAAATAQPGAIVALDISDPCRPDTRIDIRHAGLEMSDKTDAAGLLTLDIPALETPAFFTIRNAAGEEVITFAGLPDLDDYLRAAIFWEGDLSLELQHEPRAATQGPETPAPDAQAPGQITRLGDARLAAPRRAQIYSVSRARAADLAFALEIPITATSCGQGLRAQGAFHAGDAALEITPISLTLPACDGMDGYLVLQNLFDRPRTGAN